MTTNVLQFNRDIFRGFSIRGVAGRDLSVEHMHVLGRSVATWFRQNSGRAVVVGHDVRVTSAEYSAALVKGLLQSGLDVYDLGSVPTPLLNFAVDYLGLDGGIMVTASHNPPEYNGLKIRSQRTVHGSDLQDLYIIATSGEYASGAGKLDRVNVREAYVDVLRQRISLPRAMRIVIDSGNGSNWLLAPAFFRELGCDVAEVFCEADGRFPNRDPDPTAPNATNVLARTVVNNGAELGLAFDGDGDRVILVDDLGRTLLGDECLMVLARNLLERGASKVVCEVLCTHALVDDIIAHKGEPIVVPSGYAYVHDAMLETGARLGGELSGHFFILDEQIRFDDSILAAATLLQISALRRSPLSKIVSELPRYWSSRELRLPCPDTQKSDIVLTVLRQFGPTHPIETIDGVSIKFGGAWALVRQSNTQPILSVRFESSHSAEQLDLVQREVLGYLELEYRSRGLDWPKQF